MATPKTTSQTPADGFYPREALPASLSAWVHPRKPEHIGVDVVNGVPRTRVKGAEVAQVRESTPIEPPPFPGVFVGIRTKDNYGTSNLLRVEVLPVEKYENILPPSEEVLKTYKIRELRNVAKRTCGFKDYHLQAMRSKKDLIRLIMWAAEGDNLERYWLWKAVQPDA